MKFAAIVLVLTLCLIGNASAVCSAYSYCMFGMQDFFGTGVYGCAHPNDTMVGVADYWCYVEVESSVRRLQSALGVFNLSNVYATVALQNHSAMLVDLSARVNVLQSMVQGLGNGTVTVVEREVSNKVDRILAITGIALGGVNVLIAVFYVVVFVLQIKGRFVPRLRPVPPKRSGDYTDIPLTGFVASDGSTH